VVAVDHNPLPAGIHRLDGSVTGSDRKGSVPAVRHVAVQDWSGPKTAMPRTAHCGWQMRMRPGPTSRQHLCAKVLLVHFTSGATNCGSLSHCNRIQVSCETSVMNVSTAGRPAGLA